MPALSAEDQSSSPAPMLSGSQPLVTPAPGDVKASSLPHHTARSGGICLQTHLYCRDKWVPRACWPASLAYWVVSRPMGNLVCKNKVNSTKQCPVSSTYSSTWMHLHKHEQTHMHTCTTVPRCSLAQVPYILNPSCFLGISDLLFSWGKLA